MWYTYNMDRDKVGIFTMTPGGNLRNIATGEIIISPETSEEIEDELYKYVTRRERRASEYCFIKGGSASKGVKNA